MSGAFQYLDIIIFGTIAVFLIAKLVGVLGKRTGNEQDAARRRPQPFPVSREAGDNGGDNVIALPDREANKPAMVITGPAADGLNRIAAADANFNPAGFLNGGRAAFEMIVAAFANDDLDTLKRLLSPQVYDDFAAAIADRQSRGWVQDTTLIGLKASDFVAANLVNGEAQVTVRFVSDQVNVTKDSEGRVIEGDPNQVAEVTDIWTFSREVTSRDPNWRLSATTSPDA
ncbi:MAG: Tim44/TimA family putative adaptor protein [Alphaproteobacteria bacterium]